MSSSPGLSYSHIRSQEEKYTLIPAKVSYYGDGNLATVSREIVEKPCASCGELFKIAKWKSETNERVKNDQVKHEEKNRGSVEWNLCRACRGVLSGGKRGDVVEFSINSRRRLMRMLATLQKDVRPVFVTLTFSDTYQNQREPLDWKRCLRAFEHRFRREFPDGSFVWRLEVIDRKSGEHIGEPFPHFHLLVFGVPYGTLRSFVPVAWYEVVGTGDEKHFKAGTQVSRIYSRNGIMRYASKTVANLPGELGKDSQALAHNVGRWWGVVVRDNFRRFVAELKEMVLEDVGSIRLLRIFRRKSHAFGRDYRSLTVFIDGGFLEDVVPKIVDPVMELKLYRATGRRIDEPFWSFAYRTGRWEPELDSTCPL